MRRIAFAVLGVMLFFALPLIAAQRAVVIEGITATW